MSGKINYAKAFAGCGVALMDRVQGNAGANITQASITSISYECKRYTSKEDAENAQGGTATTNGSLTVASVVFDTLQTSAPWDADSTGYNFRHNLVAADRPATNTETVWDRVDDVFAPVSGEPFAVVWIVETMPMQ